MKIVVAPDSFKGSLRSDEAGSIIAHALQEQLRDVIVVVIPVADGGEGTTDAVIRATGASRHQVRVTGPLGDPVTASYGLLPDGRTAVMEMAAASGIELVPADRLDPMAASTVGTGELLRAMLGTGVAQIIIGVGGSATVDGGIGMAQALGVRLLDCNGNEVGRGGQALAAIAEIDTSELLPAITTTRIRVACDVTSPLLGATGAARTFAPQKGATPAMVDKLEQGLANLARVWRQTGLLDTVDRPGDGAAGGLGAGLRACCRAELCSGAELIAELSGFDREIKDATLLITGEGRTDAQTASGKLGTVLAARARSAGVPTILISGSIEAGQAWLVHHFAAAFACVPAAMPPALAMAQARKTLAACAGNVAKVLAIGRQLGRR